MAEVNIIYSAIASALAGGSASFIVIKYLSKKTIEHQLSKKIESYKNELTAKTEKLKTSLSILSHEQNIKASRIDLQKAEAIGKVYESFSQLVLSIHSFANDNPIPVSCEEEYYGHDSQSAREYSFYTERAEKAKECALELYRTLVTNAIYLQPQVYLEILGVQRELLRLTEEYLGPIQVEQTSRDDVEEIVEELLKTRADLAQFYNEGLVKFVDELVVKFRVELGTGAV
ncbi:hypothetical protein AB4589_18990 [Vibrio sp. 10N.222.49.A3]|uniref:Chromosome partitioning protein ParA n=1 Tax=Vibrio splendidus TaxID=29497 RepID=A0AB35MUX6_VIBSP|nr:MULTISPECIES: hypothetical protein [Vibrio]MDP2500128.1 hypothetical protein [Vibrio splendidus]NOI55476.1 hypothetical protein [Vibrio crassostreae]